MIPTKDNLNHIMRNSLEVVRTILKQADQRLETTEKDLNQLSITSLLLNVEYILLHHSLTKDSQTVSWDAIRQYHTRDLGWQDIGYHFGIELIGDHYEILAGRMLGEPGAHCKEQDMNRKSIGICFLGNFDLEPPVQKQWELGLKLVRSLSDIFEIPRNKVTGHREYAPYKSCPGTRFDLDRFRKEI